MTFSTSQLDTIADYIRANWDKSVHMNKPGETLIEPLPYPHTSPCISGHFVAFFYWDTYFTNLGLLEQDRLDLAKGNCDDMIYLINLKGFIPNSTFPGDDTRSQPPYFSMMVRDLYEKAGDKRWLAEAVIALKKEYKFWMEKRLTPTHLNRHFHHASKEYLLNFFRDTLVGRIGVAQDLPEDVRLTIAANYLGEAETGWDFNSRFSGRCGDFNPVDLNSNLYLYEKNFAWFAQELGQPDAAEWEAKAEQRRVLMQEHLWSEEKGLYFDFDYQAARQSTVPSLATFHPLWAGLATPKQARRVRDHLALFEFDYGISVCARNENKVFQWNYPNGWPPLFYTTMSGLLRYGFKEDAIRLSTKFLDLNVKHFERTGQLWEKFDVTTGKVAGGEYEAQPMLGWTAGTFLALRKLIS